MREAARERKVTIGWAGLAVAAMLLLCISVAATRAEAEDPAPVPISDGTLTWGIKTSWVQYVGAGEMSGGVTARLHEGGLVPSYVYDFPITGGSYDPATKTTTIEAAGTIHWQKYPADEFTQFPPPPGYTGPLDIHILDVTFTEPRLTISSTGSVLTAEAVARNQVTWELIDHGRIAVVELDAASATPTVSGGVTTWDEIPAALTEDGAHNAFGGGYRTGQFVNPVSFSYTGPGGAPDFGEHWTEPDSTGISQVHNTFFGVTPTLDFFWEQPADGIVHNEYSDEEGNKLRAIDVRTGEVVGEPIARTSRMANYMIADTETGTLYYRSVSSSSPVDTYLRWNGGDEKYEVGSVPPFTTRGNPNSALWDPVRGRAFTINLQVPEGVGTTDYENHIWYLNVYTRQEDGSFTEDRYQLPSAPTGWNRRWYSPATGDGTVLPDGSIVINPGTVNSPAPGAVELDTIPIPRVTIDEEAGTATVTPVPGASVPHSELSTRKPDRMFASAQGFVSLMRQGTSIRPTRIRQYEFQEDGTLVPFGGEVQIPVGLATAVAFDPSDGTVWNLDSEPKRLTAVRDGRVAATHSFPIIHPKSPHVGVLPDHSLYFVSSDGQPIGLGESLHGIAYYKWDGYSPTVTGQPADESVDVDIGGSGEVEFSAAATGTPAPTVQWQRRAPGSSSFAELPGETATTLEVDAAAADNGATYRAVFANPAGSLATEPAELEVRYAPAVSFDPVDLSVIEGEDAEFSILATGSPEPGFLWQRRVNGFWEAVDPDSGDFEVDGNTLVVKDANLAMSGAEFRARLSNPVGTAFTDEATLTVTEPPPTQVTFGSGNLDWGVKQSFRNYIGGPIAHGSYTASSGAAVNPDGTVRFDVLGGTYDSAAGEGEIETVGVVRFTGHDSGGGPLLDLKIADPRIEFDETTGTLFADVTSRGLADGHHQSYPDVALATLDLSGAGPAPLTGGLAFAPVGAVLTAQGSPAFADFYPGGTALDPIAVDAFFGTPREAPPGPRPDPDPPAEDPTPAPPSTLSVPIAPPPAATPRCKGGKKAVKRRGKVRCLAKKKAGKAKRARGKGKVRRAPASSRLAR